MIVSKKWMQKYFETPLPEAAAIADAFTFHAFEIDGIEENDGDTVFDVKVLPNRAADCLSHRGVARELAAILNQPAKPDTLRDLLPPFPHTDLLSISVEDARACPRYMAALVRGVKVGPSPVWLREALEAVGQRSINNVVDATNYVMLDLGQPLHAFDANKLVQDANGAYAIAVRNAHEGEKVTTLSGDEFALPENTLVITDANAGSGAAGADSEGNGAGNSAIGIAGIKGGKAAEITEATTDIILESANFDATLVRRASQRLKLWTDAGKRFQNNLSPELAAYGMRDVLALIQRVAGGELIGVADRYPAPQEATQVPVSVSRVNALLGTGYSGHQVEDVFRRLGLAYKKAGEDFVVDPPFERRDISIPEDLIEEVGRIQGYDGVPSTPLPPIDGEPDQARFRGIERMKDQLIEQGYSEISSQSFAKEGDIALANPLDDAKPWLRTSLEEGLSSALAQAKRYAPRILKPGGKPRLFEVGTVFERAHRGNDAASPTGGSEHVELRMTERVPAWGDAVGVVDNLTVADMEGYGKDYVPAGTRISAFKPFSNYPFILRDIALWTPAGTGGDAVGSIIRDAASQNTLPAQEDSVPPSLLARVDQFDRFEKDGRVSYAFRLVFEAMDRTLSDDDVNPVMETIAAALRAAGFEVR